MRFHIYYYYFVASTVWHAHTLRHNFKTRKRYDISVLRVYFWVLLTLLSLVLSATKVAVDDTRGFSFLFRLFPFFFLVSPSVYFGSTERYGRIRSKYCCLQMQYLTWTFIAPVLFLIKFREMFFFRVCCPPFWKREII